MWGDGGVVNVGHAYTTVKTICTDNISMAEYACSQECFPFILLFFTVFLQIEENSL